eukprot:TRINITY_DN5161_c0_g2_i2.p1 TRINITY_DN5161_c0_g2~~TRINITY_DN5161_c0_g2_i2.p1  ORF type:complete len:243 (+),score=-18.26 TRINITY_DN5161_c0_g2_i2:503-1231(+)
MLICSKFVVKLFREIQLQQQARMVSQWQKFQLNRSKNKLTPNIPQLLVYLGYHFTVCSQTLLKYKGHKIIRQFWYSIANNRFSTMRCYNLVVTYGLQKSAYNSQSRNNNIKQRCQLIVNIPNIVKNSVFYVICYYTYINKTIKKQRINPISIEHQLQNAQYMHTLASDQCTEWKAAYFQNQMKYQKRVIISIATCIRDQKHLRFQNITIKKFDSITSHSKKFRNLAAKILKEKYYNVLIRLQ